MEVVAATYYGVPSLTTTGYDVTSSADNDSNADYAIVAISATKGLTRDV